MVQFRCYRIIGPKMEDGKLLVSKVNISLTLKDISQVNNPARVVNFCAILLLFFTQSFEEQTMDV